MQLNYFHFQIPQLVLFCVIMAILSRCSIPLQLCREQAFDGVASMQGKRNIVATKIKNEVPASLQSIALATVKPLPAGCWKELNFLRDSLDIVKEIAILLSSHQTDLIFFMKRWLSQISIKPLCTTCWTGHTDVIEAVLTLLLA